MRVGRVQAFAVCYPEHELVTNPIGHVDGWVSPPEGPGVDVDEAVVRRYRFREDALGR